MRRFLLASLTFLLGAILFTVGVYIAVTLLRTPPESVDQARAIIEASLKGESKEAGEAATTSQATLLPEGGLPLASLALSADQKARLEKLGIDVETFVLSNTMVLCAEEKLGTTRISEFKSGNRPSALELTKLTPCLVAQ